MRSKEPAICLRTMDYSETSQIASFLTRDTGLVRVIAKGTRKPTKKRPAATIDMLAEGELLFSQKNPDSLGLAMEFTETVSHSNLRQNAKTLNTALYMIEIVNALLAENDPHPEVFTLLSNSLDRMGHNDAPRQAVLCWFQWRLLRHVGLLGGLDSCVACNMDVLSMAAEKICYFTSRHGGLLCSRCLAPDGERTQVEPNVLAGLAALAAAETGKKVALPEHQAAPVTKLLNYHIAQQLNKMPKMAKYIL